MRRMTPVQWCVTWAIVALCAMTQAWGQTEYRLGPEDVIAVQVLNHPEFSGEFVVPSSGSVSLPVLGDTKVAGTTLAALRVTITEGLKVRLLKPEVNVYLKVPRPKRVYVYGEVQKPGVLQLVPGWRIQEAVGAAGGLIPGTQESDVAVTLEHSDKTTQRMPLGAAMSNAVELAEGDIVRVQARALVPVYVSGKVKAPALYRLREGEAGVLEAITQAGGVLPEASLTGVKVVRLNGGEEKVDISPAFLRGEPVKLAPLGPGDMVIVPESTERYVILGYVQRTGYYSLPSGQTLNLSQAVALAGGNTVRARMSRVGLIRIVDGKETRTVYDLGKYLRTGETKLNPVLKAGDVIFVPETDKFDLSTLLGPASVVRLLFPNV